MMMEKVVELEAREDVRLRVSERTLSIIFFLLFCVSIANFIKARNPLASQVAVTFVFTPGDSQALKKFLGPCCAMWAGCTRVEGWHVTVPVLIRQRGYSTAPFFWAVLPARSERAQADHTGLF